MRMRNLIIGIALLLALSLPAEAARRHPAGGMLQVHVVGGGGHVRLVIRSRRGNRMSRRTNLGGMYAGRIAPGRYIVRARRPGRGAGRAAVSVHAGATSNVTIVLRGGRRSFHPRERFMLGLHGFRHEHAKAGVTEKPKEGAVPARSPVHAGPVENKATRQPAKVR